MAGSGLKCVTPCFVLQARAEPTRAENELGLGLTVSRRVGKAVQRNRARRRLRAAAEAILPEQARAQYDYVIVGRQAVLTCPFDRLLVDLAQASRRVITPRKPRSRPLGAGSAGPSAFRSTPTAISSRP